MSTAEHTTKKSTGPLSPEEFVKNRVCGYEVIGGHMLSDIQDKWDELLEDSLKGYLTLSFASNPFILKGTL